MKFLATFLLLAVAATCISAQRQTVWGDVHNTRILSEQKVVVSSQILRVQERTVTYRSVSVEAIGRISSNILHPNSPDSRFA